MTPTDQNEQPQTNVQEALTNLVNLIAVKVAECDDTAEALKARRASLQKDLDDARKALAAVSEKKRKAKRKAKRVAKVVDAVKKLDKMLPKTKETK